MSRCPRGETSETGGTVGTVETLAFFRSRSTLDLVMPSSPAISRMDFPSFLSPVTLMVCCALAAVSSSSLRCSFSWAYPMCSKWRKPRSDTISYISTLSESYLYPPALTLTCLT